MKLGHALSCLRRSRRDGSSLPCCIWFWSVLGRRKNAMKNRQLRIFTRRFSGIPEKGGDSSGLRLLGKMGNSPKSVGEKYRQETLPGIFSNCGGRKMRNVLSVIYSQTAGGIFPAFRTFQKIIPPGGRPLFEARSPFWLVPLNLIMSIKKNMQYYKIAIPERCPPPWGIFPASMRNAGDRAKFACVVRVL